MLAASLLLSGTLFTTALQAHPGLPSYKVAVDSIGIEKKDGKLFILHKVTEGQTMYAVARRYGRAVAEIKAANPGVPDALRYNQVIRVPVPEGSISRKQEKALTKAIREEEKMKKRESKAKETAKAEPAAKVETPEAKANKEIKKSTDPTQSDIHVVEAGQTLYSLAQRYNVSQSDLRKWNNLTSNNVLIGQALITSEKAYQARTPSTPYKAAAKTADSSTRSTRTTPERTPKASRPEPKTEPKPEAKPEPKTETKTESKPEPKTDRPAPEAARPEAPTPAVTPKPSDDVVVETPRAGNDAPMPTRGRRISSSGIAEEIEGSDNSGKYLALHRSAPIGSLVQVRNAFNNQSVWVKVVGRLPDTGVNDKILIKLSSQAFTKLSPNDQRFRADVSYIVR
ncbi:LysM peptidoglycan-binding domain-containing protein [Spirosoma sp. KUDC1026]|nr:LysM peptidoglycan-binding domain-containing protein [Spirosoma sp. KUDC1026]